MGSILVEKTKLFSSTTLIAIDAAIQAGKLLKEGFGTCFTISSKEGKHNLVTEYDHLSEKKIIDFLKTREPNSHFLAEESGSSGTDTHDLLWIIDPLDGTVNFAHEIPIFAVSIAAQKNGKIVSGVVYQPITDELFAAEIGKGAYLNGKKLQTSAVKQLDRAMLATGFPYNLAQNPSHCIEHFIEILKLGIPVRRLGAAAIDLAYTAAGKFDGFFEVELAPWDVAAGKLLIEEAGGRVTHWDQTPFDIKSRKTLLASNGHIHQQIGTVLNRSS